MNLNDWRKKVNVAWTLEKEVRGQNYEKDLGM